MQVPFSEPMKPHGGAPQPADSTADASQLGGLPILRLKASGNGREMFVYSGIDVANLRGVSAPRAPVLLREVLAELVRRTDATSAQPGIPATLLSLPQRPYRPS